MAVVIVSDRPKMALAQGQAGLAPLQRLTPAFLIAAKHYRMVWRVEINSDDVPEFGFELFVTRQFEDPRPMRLNVVGGPDALHGGLGYSHMLGHRTGTPPSRPSRRPDRFAQDSAFERRLNALWTPAASQLRQAPHPFS